MSTVIEAPAVSDTTATFLALRFAAAGEFRLAFHNASTIEDPDRFSHVMFKIALPAGVMEDWQTAVDCVQALLVKQGGREAASIIGDELSQALHNEISSDYWMPALHAPPLIRSGLGLAVALVEELLGDPAGPRDTLAWLFGIKAAVRSTNSAILEKATPRFLKETINTEAKFEALRHYLENITGACWETDADSNATVITFLNNYAKIDPIRTASLLSSVIQRNPGSALSYSLSKKSIEYGLNAIATHPNTARSFLNVSLLATDPFYGCQLTGRLDRLRREDLNAVITFAESARGGVKGPAGHVIHQAVREVLGDFSGRYRDVRRVHKALLSLRPLRHGKSVTL